MEQYMVKFTGKFTNLKKLGYEFHKLYARNYKVYSKKIPKSFDIWVWVGQGGYIEINDFYSNTKNIVDVIKAIKWDEVKEQIGFLSKEPYKRVFVRFNHSHPERGAILSDQSLEIETILSMPKKYRDNFNAEKYDIAYKKIRETYDREVVVFEESAKTLLAELKLISK